VAFYFYLSTTICITKLGKIVDYAGLSFYFPANTVELAFPISLEATIELFFNDSD
jgi:hypothetical protein